MPTRRWTRCRRPLLLLTLVLIGVMAPTRDAAAAGSPVLTVTTFMSGLQAPWDLAFTPDGAMLYTEKCRGLSVRLADGTVRRLFGVKGYAVEAGDLFCEGQSGMHGVAIDPDFARGSRHVYVFMASNLSTGPRTNRVVRLAIDDGYTTVGKRTDAATAATPVPCP